MSVKKWRQREEEKAELEEQEQQIRQKFKMNRIDKEFGQLSGEELFKPITKRLDKVTKEPEPAKEPAAPNYEMDDFDRLNPWPDAETPSPTPSPTPPPSPTASPEEEEDVVSPPPLEEKRNTWEAPAATPFLQRSNESTDLGTVKKLITKYGGDPNYRVKSGKFKGMSVEDLERARDEILRRRGQLPPRSPLEDDSWEREIEGSGLGASDADKLINQLYVSLGSIKAGNTSKKLQKQVVDLVQMLFKHDVINEFQRQKIINDYIAP